MSADIKTPRRIRKQALRGYLYGVEAAASYLGISRSAFRSWRDDAAMPGRELLQPRIIRGDSYYSIRKLDTFMDPANNPPGAVTECHIVAGT
jgi:hypothetical protein